MSKAKLGAVWQKYIYNIEKSQIKLELGRKERNKGTKVVHGKILVRPVMTRTYQNVAEQQQKKKANAGKPGAQYHLNKVLSSFTLINTMLSRRCCTSVLFKTASRRFEEVSKEV